MAALKFVQAVCKASIHYWCRSPLNDDRFGNRSERHLGLSLGNILSCLLFVLKSCECQFAVDQRLLNNVKNFKITALNSSATLNLQSVFKFEFWAQWQCPINIGIPLTPLYPCIFSSLCQICAYGSLLFILLTNTFSSASPLPIQARLNLSSISKKSIRYLSSVLDF